MAKRRNLTYKEKVLAAGKKHKKKALPHSLIALGLCIILLISARLLEPEPSASDVPDTEGSIFTASMVGDMMMGRHVEEVMNNHGDDYIFEHVAPVFEASDYTTGNFENPVILNEDEYDSADKIIHLFSKPRAVEALQNAHFTTINLANNHMMDYQLEGLETTLRTFSRPEGAKPEDDTHLDPELSALLEAELPQYDVQAIGGGRDLEDAMLPSYHTYDVNGQELTVATVGFNDVFYSAMEQADENSPGVLTTDPSYISDTLQAVEADLVIAHIHAGQEYDSAPTSRQKELMRFMADAGADIVVGHHPHVLQSVDIYNDSIIMYSIGNFVFDQGWTRTRDTVIANYQLQDDGQATLEMLPYRIFESQPRPLTGAAADLHKQRIFRQLTKDTTHTEFIRENDERLIFEVDHSHVIERMNEPDEEENAPPEQSEESLEEEYDIEPPQETEEPQQPNEGIIEDEPVEEGPADGQDEGHFSP
ncbi:CapA family protein [Thalassobacillus sp. C254]|uniref:CapA family protein n=1 Tax=Thalassobacillus sp. C254 TaxID=1225341 RepID=UPI0006D0B9E3|nr:CapA family protein [Thalassobacillus sp. C254]